MMESVLILGKGLLTGVLVAMPPGVIMVMCIQRTLSKSLKSGIVSGVGAAAGNTLAATIAAFFLGIVLPVIEQHLNIIKIIFGIVIIVLGISIFMKNPASRLRKSNVNKRRSTLNDFLSVFMVAFANPGFLVTYIAFFAFWGIRGEWIDILQGLWLIGGVFIGAAVWWIFFNLIINKLRKRFKMQYILYLNRGSGIAVILLGIIAIITSF